MLKARQKITAQLHNCS